MEEISQDSQSKLKIIRWVRLLGVPLAILLIFLAVRDILNPPFDPPWFFRLRGGLEIVVGLLILMPFGFLGRQRPRCWKRLFLLLLVVSVLFVFARVIGVLFEARVVEAAGGDLGLPAWSGTLIFLVLAQLPLILFLRFPDQLD